MAKEIERRFLVDKNKLPKLKRGYLQVQGYLGPYPKENEPSVRVRVEKNKGFLTLKWLVNTVVREEFEFPIPTRDARYLLTKTSHLVEKIRYSLITNGGKWEIDFFQKENFPLVIAEIELRGEKDSLNKPLWLDKEITSDQTYTSLHLAFYPFQKRS